MSMTCESLETSCQTYPFKSVFKSCGQKLQQNVQEKCLILKPLKLPVRIKIK